MVALYYKVIMNIIKRVVAVVEIVLVFPAALFMSALFLRNCQPPPYEPAQSARRLVDWFAGHPVLCLDVFLIAMPLAAFVIGCATVVRGWRADAKLREAALEMAAVMRAHAAALLVAGATALAGGILGIVALHLITD